MPLENGNPDNRHYRRRLTLLVKGAELTQRVATGPILTRFNLSYAQLAVLLTVARSPGASGADLARMHGITAQSAGEVIGALVRRGLLERRPDPSRARIQRITLTSAGKTMLDEAQAMLDEIDARLTQGIEPAKLEVAREVLTSIIHNGGSVLSGIA